MKIWNRRLTKIVGLALTVSIVSASTNFVDIIRANEIGLVGKDNNTENTNSEVNKNNSSGDTVNVGGIEMSEEIADTIPSNDISTRASGDVSFDGKVSVAGAFKVSGIKTDGNGNNRYTITENDANQGFEIRDNRLTIGTTDRSRPRQTVMMTSKFKLDLNRSFEIRGSLAMNTGPDGFAFAIHQNENYIAQNTSGSLGVYNDPNFNLSNRPGLGNALVMEVDPFKNHQGEFGDIHARGKHLMVLETNDKGQFGCISGNCNYGKLLKNHTLSDYHLSKYKNQPPVPFVIKWDTKFTGSNGYPNDNGRLNIMLGSSSSYPGLDHVESTLLTNMKKISRKPVNISFSGSVHLGDSNGSPIDIYLDSVKYTDLTPNVSTRVMNKEGTKDITTVYPGQEISIRHTFKNTTPIDSVATEGLSLHMLYLQLVNSNSEVVGPARYNFDPYNIRQWSDHVYDPIFNEQRPPYFNTHNPIKVYFPPKSKEYYVQYNTKVLEAYNDPSLYGKNLDLFFHGQLGGDGMSTADIKEWKNIRLVPKLQSTRASAATDVIDGYEVFNATNKNGDGSVSKDNIKNQLWNNLLVSSSGGANKPIGINATNQHGADITYKYYYNERAVNENDIPNSIPKGNSVSIAVEAKDKKNNQLRNYFYRTVVVADEMNRNKNSGQNGNNVIYGNHLSSYTETMLNLKATSQFQTEFKNNSIWLQRNTDNSQFSTRAFTKRETTINFSNDWISNGKMDLKGGDSITPNGDGSKEYQQQVQAADGNNSTNINLRFNVTANTVSIEKDDNSANGQTGYVIIPSSIALSDKQDKSGISGEGKVYMSGYNTKKQFHVWADPIVTLSSTTVTNKKINVNVAGEATGDHTSPGITNKKYLGHLDSSRTVNANPLLVKLSGKHDIKEEAFWKGTLTFYFARKN